MSGSRPPRPSASATATVSIGRQHHGRARGQPGGARCGHGQLAVAPGAVDDLRQQVSGALQAEQLEHARIVGAGAPVAERRGRCRRIRGALAGAEEIDAVLGRERGRGPVQHAGAMLGQPGERGAVQRCVDRAAGDLADLARRAVLAPARDHGLGAPVVRQPRRRHGIAVIVDQPGAAGSARDRERGRARRQVRHHLAQPTQRGRRGPPGCLDLLLGAAVGERHLTWYRRGDARDLVTTRRKGRRLDARRADVESDQEIAGQGHRRSIAHRFVPPTVPWRPWRPVNGRVCSAIERESTRSRRPRPVPGCRA